MRSFFPAGRGLRETKKKIQREKKSRRSPPEISRARRYITVYLLLYTPFSLSPSLSFSFYLSLARMHAFFSIPFYLLRSDHLAIPFFESDLEYASTAGTVVKFRALRKDTLSGEPRV